MLSEVRKMKLAVMLAHQYLAQLPESLRSAVLGNVGTIISFRVGVEAVSYTHLISIPKTGSLRHMWTGFVR